MSPLVLTINLVKCPFLKQCLHRIQSAIFWLSQCLQFVVKSPCDAAPFLIVFSL